MKSIKRYFEESGRHITAHQSTQLMTYYEFLIEKNRVMNLTGITDYEEAVYKHFIDSATIDRLDLALEGRHVVDVGTGAGFPGMVLAVLYPDTDFTLVDSLQKRIRFLEELQIRLGLKNVRCYHARGEDFAKKYPQAFDIGVSRAVARMEKLADFVLPLIKNGGLFIAFKGHYEAAEATSGESRLKHYNAKTERIDRFSLTGDGENMRTLVQIRRR
ncbi:MAG: 16S rRNA (guanine(527)-N(7))-methyltransferase RsmG [Eubacteriales bacterium]|nr:16S rRNA (guanine(527)-N(7))-methyltransferase RsmG [Eubacteriales bacterium]